MNFKDQNNWKYVKYKTLKYIFIYVHPFSYTIFFVKVYIYLVSFPLSEELHSISTRFFILQADLREMNPSVFFFFFPKSKKVFYFILILNYFLPAGCRSLRWKISFSFSVLKTLLPFLFLIALFLMSNLLTFIFVSHIHYVSFDLR